MWDVMYYLLVVIFLAAAVVALAFVVRAFMAGVAPADAISTLFGPKPPRRLDVVEQSSIDGRRRLILIRRDDVEHLIMTGGPIDMVIETGISTPPMPSVELQERPTPVYTRPARSKKPEISTG